MTSVVPNTWKSSLRRVSSWTKRGYGEAAILGFDYQAADGRVKESNGQIKARIGRLRHGASLRGIFGETASIDIESGGAVCGA